MALTITPTIARYGIVVSITIGISMIAMYAMVINGGKSLDHTTPHHPVPEASAHKESDDVDADLLQEGATEGHSGITFEDFMEHSGITFEDFMQRVKSQERSLHRQVAEKAPNEEDFATLVRQLKQAHTADTKQAVVLEDVDGLQAQGKRLSGEVDALSKMANAAKDEWKQIGDFKTEVKPADEHMLSNAHGMLKAAKAEYRAQALKKKERRDKKVLDITEDYTKDLDDRIKELQKAGEAPSVAEPSEASGNVTTDVAPGNVTTDVDTAAPEAEDAPEAVSGAAAEKDEATAEAEKDEATAEDAEEKAKKLEKEAKKAKKQAKKAKEAAKEIAKAAKKIAKAKKKAEKVPEGESGADAVAAAGAQLKHSEAKVVDEVDSINHVLQSAQNGSTPTAQSDSTPTTPAALPNQTTAIDTASAAVQNGEVMPRLPGAPGCAAALKVGEATCRLEYWKAVDKCTSETLSNKEAFATKQCKDAQAHATKACMAALSSCSPADAAAEARRLGNAIMIHHDPVAAQNILNIPKPEQPPTLGLHTEKNGHPVLLGSHAKPQVKVVRPRHSKQQEEEEAAPSMPPSVHPLHPESERLSRLLARAEGERQQASANPVISQPEHVLATLEAAPDPMQDPMPSLPSELEEVPSGLVLASGAIDKKIAAMMDVSAMEDAKVGELIEEIKTNSGDDDQLLQQDLNAWSTNGKAQAATTTRDGKQIASSDYFAQFDVHN